jgi:hypothetical protein
MLRARIYASLYLSLLGLTASLSGCERSHSVVEATSLPASTPAVAKWPEFFAHEPAPDSRAQPVVIREISPLDDELMRRVRALASDMQRGPSTPRNVRSRLALVQEYYDALQAEGVLLNYSTNMSVNAIASFLIADIPPPPDLRNRIAGLDQALLELMDIHASVGRTGVIRVLSRESPVIEAKSYQTLTFEYEIGERPIKEGGRIRLGYNLYADVGDIQFTRPHDSGYTTVKSSNPDVKLVAGPAFWFGQMFTALRGAYTRSVSVIEGSLEPGDTVTLTIGDRSQGSPGWLAQSFTIDSMDFRFEVDFDGDGLWVPVAQPRFEVIGTTHNHLRVIAPSVVYPGEALQLRVNVEDAYFNEASSGPDKLIVYLDGEVAAETGPVEGIPGRFLFPPIVVSESVREEPVYLEVRSEDGRLAATSNPVMVRPAGTQKLYWGEMHGHEGYTDGNGTPDWYMDYARNVAFLDFATLTGHDLMLSELHFRDVLRATREHNDPAGGFLTFPAYEWTIQWTHGGHHNVFYLDEDQRVISTSMSGTLNRMLQMQRQHNDSDRVLVIPHAHQPGDWNAIETDLGPLVEIYSNHGSFEWFGRRYLDTGHRVGFNAASDDHIGHPGNSPARTQVRGGLAAVYADELSRESVFASLKNRNTYATTLARMILETDVAGGGMGEIVSVVDVDSVTLRGAVAGTAPIASITAVVNGQETLIADYANATEDTGQLWFRISSSSEPDNPALPRTPRPVVRYLGMVQLIGDVPTMLHRMHPVGTEPYGDFEAQVAPDTASFSWRVRGDYDAMLLDLNPQAALQQVWVRIWKLPIEPMENWSVLETPRLPGQFARRTTEVPGGTLLVDRHVEIGELFAGVISGEIERNAQWALSFVAQDLPSFRSFSLNLGREQGLRGDNSDCVYVRARQLDDHTAWGSPTFVEVAR